MRVEELIEELSKLPPDAEIFFEGHEDDEIKELIAESVQEAIDDSEVNIKNNWQLLPLKEE